MTNLLQANGLTAFSNVDYDTFKEWQNVFVEKFSTVDFNALTDEQTFHYGAHMMLDDVIAMIENPATETVKAFKQLTAPSINPWIIGGIVVSVAISAWLAPGVVYISIYGKKAYYEKVRRGSWVWKTLI